MKIVVIFLLVLIACESNNGRSHIQSTDERTNSIRTDSTKDTSMLGMQISQQENDKLEGLKMKDRKAYAREILKRFAYCECMYRSLIYDSTFTKEDISHGILELDFVIHKHDVVDSIKKIVNQYLLPPNTIGNPDNPNKNHSYRCLDLYNSEYLDSVVKSYDNKIIISDTSH